MNVLSRRMFKKNRSRPARDALNRAGGIMSSSPELMNTVQRFQSGGDVFSITGQRQFGSDGIVKEIPFDPLPEIDFSDIQMVAPRLPISDAPDFQKNVPYRKTMAFEKQLLNLQKQSSLYPDKPFVGKIADPEGKGFPIFQGGELRGFTTAMEGKTIEPPQETSVLDMYKKGIASQVSRELADKDRFESGVKDLFYSPKDRETLGGDIVEYGKSLLSVPQTVAGLGALGLKKLLESPGTLYETIKTENPPPGVDISGIAADVRQDEPFVPGETTVGGPSQKQLEEEAEKAAQFQEFRNIELAEGRRAADQAKAEQQSVMEEYIKAGGSQAEQRQAELEAARVAQEFSNMELAEGRRAAEQEKIDEGADRLAEVEGDADEASKIAREAMEEQDAKSLEAQEASFDQPEGMSRKDLDTIREETRMQQGQISASGENIAKSVETGNQDALSSQLKDLMAQFTSNAPKYKGLDKGMALMKIGFAMAAGRSPYAMQNIANALSDGADMFIKDKAERDAFDRQVQLSALQYGLGEITKDKAQQRLDERSFTDFYDEDGNLVRVSAADYFRNGNKLPEGLQDKVGYTTIQKAIIERDEAIAKALQDAKDDQKLSATEQRKIKSDYADAVKRASQAETAGTLIETVMMNADSIIGGGPAVKQASANFLALFGLDTPKGWNSQKIGVQDLKAALQSVVPVTLGSTQSANSISNRDVELLIGAFLGEGGIMKENQDGTFAFLTTSKEAFLNSLQNGLREVRSAQARHLNTMSSIEDDLMNDFLTAGGRPGISLIEQFKKDSPAGAFGATAKEGVTVKSLEVGDDGIWDVVG